MPFKKVGENRNVSPSGRVFTDKQVRLYHATDGFTKDIKKPRGLKPRNRYLKS